MKSGDYSRKVELLATLQSSAHRAACSRLRNAKRADLKRRFVRCFVKAAIAAAKGVPSHRPDWRLVQVDFLSRLSHEEGT